MHTARSTKQSGQGLSTSLAALTFISVVGVIIYTIIDKEKDKSLLVTDAPTTPLKTPINSDLKNIEQRLALSFLNTRKRSHTEDLQAIRNTLNHLHSKQHPIAIAVLEFLGKKEIPEAIAAIKVLISNTDNKREVAKLWVDIGNIEHLISPTQALNAYQQSVKFDSDNINAWNRIGHLERQNKQFSAAETAYQNVTRLSDKNTLGQALSWTNFGLLYQTQQKYTDAITAFEKALSTNSTLKNTSGMASNSENLAGLYRTQNNAEKSEQYYQQALKLYHANQQTAKQVEIHAALGSLYQHQQQTELATIEYEKALTLNTANKESKFTASLYNNMGILAQQRNELEKAKDYFTQSLNLFKAVGLTHGVANQYSNLAILSRNRKQFEESESLHLQAIELYQIKHNHGAITTQYTNLGFLYTAWDKQKQACEYWRKSLSGLSGENNIARHARVMAIVEKDCSQEASIINH